MSYRSPSRVIRRRQRTPRRRINGCVASVQARLPERLGPGQFGDELGDILTRAREDAAAPGHEHRFFHSDLFAHALETRHDLRIWPIRQFLRHGPGETVQHIGTIQRDRLDAVRNFDGDKFGSRRRRRRVGRHLWKINGVSYFRPDAAPPSKGDQGGEQGDGSVERFASLASATVLRHIPVQ